MTVYRPLTLIFFLILLTVPSAAQEDEAEGIQHLATLSGRVTDIVLYGETPHGIRVDVSFEGRLSGMVHGVMKGIDYSLVRGDDVIEIDVRASILTDDGASISAEIRGTMLDGEIRDTSVKLVTGHPAYQWLHDKIIVGKGRSVGDRLNVRYFIDL
ncbi:MAG: DUF3237 family protein [bacterium]|nr:DUF3237 family protein [bacterium]